MSSGKHSDEKRKILSDERRAIQQMQDWTQRPPGHQRAESYDPDRLEGKPFEDYLYLKSFQQDRRIRMGGSAATPDRTKRHEERRRVGEFLANQGIAPEMIYPPKPEVPRPARNIREDETRFSQTSPNTSGRRTEVKGRWTLTQQRQIEPKKAHTRSTPLISRRTHALKRTNQSPLRRTVPLTPRTQTQRTVIPDPPPPIEMPPTRQSSESRGPRMFIGDQVNLDQIKTPLEIFQPTKTIPNLRCLSVNLSVKNADYGQNSPGADTMTQNIEPSQNTSTNPINLDRNLNLEVTESQANRKLFNKISDNERSDQEFQAFVNDLKEKYIALSETSGQPQSNQNPTDTTEEEEEDEVWE